jgi:hypothetical protein
MKKIIASIIIAIGLHANGQSPGAAIYYTNLSPHIQLRLTNAWESYAKCTRAGLLTQVVTNKVVSEGVTNTVVITNYPKMNFNGFFRWIVLDQSMSLIEAAMRDNAIQIQALARAVQAADREATQPTE